MHFIDWAKSFTKPVWLDDEKFGFRFLDSQLLLFANTTAGFSETVIAAKELDRTEMEDLASKLAFRC